MKNLLLILIVYLLLMLKLKMVLVRYKKKKHLTSARGILEKILSQENMGRKENHGYKNQCSSQLSLSKPKKKSITIIFFYFLNLFFFKFLWLMLLSYLRTRGKWKMLLLIKEKFLMRQYLLCLLITLSAARFLRSLVIQVCPPFLAP